jgi:hypothetical protein
MIYRVDMRFGGAVNHLLDRVETFMPALLRSLNDVGVSAHLCWPRQDTAAVALIVDGGASPNQLQSALEEASATIDVRPTAVEIEARVDVPAELAGSSAEERSDAIIIMAAPPPGTTCGRCNAVLPPHLEWCPWGIGRWGREVTPDTGGDKGHTGPETLRPGYERQRVSAVATTETEPVPETVPELAPMGR